MLERIYIDEGQNVEVMFPPSERALQSLLATIFALAKWLGYTKARFYVERGEEHFERSYDVTEIGGGPK